MPTCLPINGLTRSRSQEIGSNGLLSPFFHLFQVRHFFGFDPINHAASLPVAASLPTNQQSSIAGSICDGSRNIENSHSALRI